MLAIAIQLLTGRYVATGVEDRDAYEWPPHPARLFSALTATWADADEPDPAERAALEWLETLTSPLIDASDADRREVVTQFVPVNDVSVLGLSLQERRHARLVQHFERLEQELEAAQGDLESARVERVLARIDKERDVEAQVQAVGKTPSALALKLLPEGRLRQPRSYPSVTPHRDIVTYAWPDVAADPMHREALDRLLSRLVRLGHSSSFVSCRLTEQVPESARFVPASDGSVRLRDVEAGQLAALERAYALHQASRPRSLPHRLATYADREEVRPPPTRLRASNMSGELIVLQRTSGPRLPIIAAVQAARAVRGALLAHAAEPICEELSGHVRGPAGGKTRPTSRPHVAFLGLPFVGREHADGRLLGFGILLPADLPDDVRQTILLAVANWERTSRAELLLGRNGRVAVERVLGRARTSNLRRSAWARPSARWSTVTPIALDRHPGDLVGGRPERVRQAYEQAQQTVVEACRHVDLPEPASVEVTLQATMTGTRPSRAFPGFEQGTGRHRVRRQLVHAHIEFPQKVGGPLVLGAGRFFGLGLLRPMDSHEEGA
jgi:CRISPR-associated protein Csb2